MSRARWQGVNLAGWLSQSPLAPAHIASFVSEADIRRIATWQFNHVRVPVAAQFLWDAERVALHEPGVAAVDRLVDWCARAGLQCFIALHLSGNTDPDPLSALHREDDRQQLTALWGAVADRYASRPGSHLAYDLVHRPTGITAASWNRTARSITEAIRAVDTRHTLVVSGADGGRPAGFDSLRPTRDPNTVYACHFYEPVLFTHQQLATTVMTPDAPHHRARLARQEHGDAYREAVPYPGSAPTPAAYPEGAIGEYLRAEVGRRWDRDVLAAALDPILAFQEIYDRPIYVASFGASCRASRRSRLTWLRSVLTLFKAHDLSWSYWTYKGLGFGLMDPWDDLSAATADDPTAGLDYDRLALLQST